MRSFAFMLALILCFDIDTSFGATVVDQTSGSDLTSGYSYVGGVGPGTFHDRAQSFTVGVGGNLVAVDIFVGRAFGVSLPLLLDVRRMNAGFPGEENTGPNVLALASWYPEGSPYGWLSLPLSPPVPVSVGDSLAITLRSNDPGFLAGNSGFQYAYLWGHVAEGSYSNGRSFRRTVGSSWQLAELAGDFAFRTYVDNGLSAPGDSESNPILPDVIGPPFEFNFTASEANQLTWFDPVIATGYEYAVQQGANFASVQMPSVGAVAQTGPYQLSVFQGGQFVHLADLQPGTTFHFDPAGVARFRITGIDASLAIDPNNTAAFPTGLSFISAGAVNFTMTPLTVPEPHAAILVAAALASLLRWPKRRQC